MGKRTNTAAWLPNQQRWQINVQKNGVRRSFTSSKPGRTGQREANAKADAWLDDGISNTRMLVEAAYPQWIGELKLTTRTDPEPVERLGASSHWPEACGRPDGTTAASHHQQRICRRTEQKIPFQHVHGFDHVLQMAASEQNVHSAAGRTACAKGCTLQGKRNIAAGGSAYTF